MKSSYQRAKAMLDQVFSIFIRIRDNRKYGHCVICRNAPIAVCFHFLPRGNLAVRWEPDNAVGACTACNYHEHMNRGRAYSDERYRDLHISLIGKERREELEKLAKTKFKKSTAELVEMKNNLEKILNQGDKQELDQFKGLPEVKS